MSIWYKTSATMLKSSITYTLLAACTMTTSRYHEVPGNISSLQYQKPACSIAAPQETLTETNSSEALISENPVAESLLQHALQRLIDLREKVHKGKVVRERSSANWINLGYPKDAFLAATTRFSFNQVTRWAQKIPPVRMDETYESRDKPPPGAGFVVHLADRRRSLFRSPSKYPAGTASRT